MSFQAVEWARALPLDSLSEKFTLLMIASYAGTDDSCFPSLAKLAEDTLQSEATVRRRIRDLEALGLLVRMARWQSPDGQVVVRTVNGPRPDDHRQTSDELRLLLKIAPTEVADRIVRRKPAGTRPKDEESSAVDTEISPQSPSGGVSNCEGGEGITQESPRGYHLGVTP